LRSSRFPRFYGQQKNSEYPEKSVRYRRVAETMLNLSEIGFGCGGNAGLMVHGSHAEQRRAVARALELGINYFDTAPDYGDGAAEANLGQVLRQLGQRPVINSKVEIRRADLANIAGHVVSSCERSLKRLGIENLDCLQIHNGPLTTAPALEDDSYRHLALQDFLRPGGALEGLHRLKVAGKINYAGFICRGGDGDEVRELLKTGQFHLINLPYTLINPTAGLVRPSNITAQPDYGGVINDAGKHGVGCAIFSPLAGGYITDGRLDGAASHPLARPTDPLSEEARHYVELAKVARFLAEDNHISLAQAAYRFILMHGHVTTVVGGFSSQEQMEEIAKVSGMGPFSSAEMTKLDRVWRTHRRTNEKQSPSR
jgi:L-glyceraldehyde 3-phosphate reductase